MEVSAPELSMVKARMLVEVAVVAKSKEEDAFAAKETGLLGAENGLPLTDVRVPFEPRVKAEMSLPAKSAEKRNFPEGSTSTVLG
jgi:hypothetical protein